MHKLVLNLLIAIIACLPVRLMAASNSTTINNPPTDKPGQLVHYIYTISSVPAPKGVVFSPDGSEIWAALLMNQKRGAAVFNAYTGEKIADINLKGHGGVELAFSKDGSKAYISQMETGQVYEIDRASKKILRTLKTGSSWTKVIEISPDGKKLYASNWTGNNVSEINLETGKLLRKIPTVRTPRGIYITKDNKTLYVAGYDRGEIQKINLETGKGKVIYKSGGAMRHIAADEENNVLYISDMNKGVVWKLDLLNDKVKKFVSTDINPNTIALSPDKKVLLVSCRGRNYSPDNYYRPGPEWGSVLLFDTSDGSMLDALVGGNQPTALTVSPDGRAFIYSNFLDNNLKIYTLPSYEELKAGNGGRSKVYKKEIKKAKY